VRYTFPNEPIFQPDQLCRIPVKVIQKALVVAAEIQLEQARIQSLAAATHAYLFASANGAKQAKFTDFDVAGQLIQQQRARQFITKRTAEIFVELSRENRIPSWAFQYLTLEFVKGALA
jgi:hypothetical protein